MFQFEIAKKQDLKEVIQLMTILDDNAEIEESIKMGYNARRRFFVYMILLKLQKLTSVFGFKLVFLVLKNDDLICGGILLPIWMKNGAKVNIANVIIKKEMRGKGLGKMLIENTLEFLHENNVKTVTLSTNSKNKPAYAIYKKYGFVEDDIIYIIKSKHSFHIPQYAKKINALKNLMVFRLLFNERQDIYVVNKYKIMFKKNNGLYYAFIYSPTEEGFKQIFASISDGGAVDDRNIDNIIVMKKYINKV